MARIMHFTDGTNLAAIFAAGAIQCHNNAATVTNAGNVGIKQRRKSVDVPVPPHGVVSDYVPFYFAERSPMLYSIQAGNVPGVRSDQRRLVYLVSTTDAAWSAGLDCVFTDGNAAIHGLTEFENDPEQLETVVDFKLMKQRMWNNTAQDDDRMRRRMAEFLVHDAFPIDLVTELVTKTEHVREWVEDKVDQAGLSLPVATRPDWYF